MNRTRNMDHLFPIRVLVRDDEARDGFSLWSRHKTTKPVERAIAELLSLEPGADIEIRDLRTGHRSRRGSVEWCRG